MAANNSKGRLKTKLKRWKKKFGHDLVQRIVTRNKNKGQKIYQNGSLKNWQFWALNSAICEDVEDKIFGLFTTDGTGVRLTKYKQNNVGRFFKKLDKGVRCGK